MVYESIKKAEFEQAELQAKLVWAIASGWKRPENIESGIDQLEKMGAVKDI